MTIYRIAAHSVIYKNTLFFVSLMISLLVLMPNAAQAALSVEPTNLEFFGVAINASGTSSVIVTNTAGADDPDVSSITVSDPNNSIFTQTNNCSNVTLFPGDSCTIEVTFSPDSASSETAVLNISGVIFGEVTVSDSVFLSGTAINQSQLESLLLPFAGSNPSVISTTIVIADTCTSGRASNRLQEDCNALIQAAGSDDPGTSRALLEITPERAVKASGVNQQAGLTQLVNSTSRIVALRNGASGFSVEGLALNINDQTLSGEHLSSLINAGDTGGAAGSEEGLFGSRWGGFITGTITSGDKDGTSLESGLDFDTKGVMAGIDYRFSDQFVLGGAIGYTKTDTDLDNDGGELDSDGYSLTAYGTYYIEDSYFIDFSASYGKNDFDQERRLSYQLQEEVTNQLATASYDGDILTLYVAGGYDFNTGGWTLGPRLSLEYIDTDIDGFTEKMSDPNGSGAGWATHMEDSDQQWLTLKLGGRVSYAHSTSWGVLSPYAGFDWLHEFKEDAQVINGNFVEDPGSMSFSIFTEDPDEDYFQLTLGVSAVLPGGVIAYVNYDTILSNDLWDRDTVNAGIRMEF